MSESAHNFAEPPGYSPFPWKTCIHEAGHAVAAMSLRGSVYKCEVFAQPVETEPGKFIRGWCATDGYLIRTDAHGRDLPGELNEHERRAVVALSGGIATQKLLGCGNWSTGDAQNFCEYVDENGGRIDAKMIAAVAVETIAKNAASVLAIARRLNAVGKVSGVEARRIYNEHRAKA